MTALSASGGIERQDRDSANSGVVGENHVIRFRKTNANLFRLLLLEPGRGSYLDAIIDDVLGADIGHANFAEIFSSRIEFAVITVLNIKDRSKPDEFSNLEPSPSRREIVRVVEQRQPHGWFHAPCVAFSSRSVRLACAWRVSG